MQPTFRIASPWACVAAIGLSLTLGACANLSPTTPAAGWLPLYDKGGNLNDWTLVGQANWRIQNDSLQADLLQSQGPSYLVSKKTHANFQILSEFRVDSQTNSGIFIH